MRVQHCCHSIISTHFMTIFLIMCSFYEIFLIMCSFHPQLIYWGSNFLIINLFSTKPNIWNICKFGVELSENQLPPFLFRLFSSVRETKKQCCRHRRDSNLLEHFKLIGNFGSFPSQSGAGLANWRAGLRCMLISTISNSPETMSNIKDVLCHISHRNCSNLCLIQFEEPSKVTVLWDYWI